MFDMFFVVQVSSCGQWPHLLIGLEGSCILFQHLLLGRNFWASSISCVDPEMHKLCLLYKFNQHWTLDLIHIHVDCKSFYTGSSPEGSESVVQDTAS